MPFFIDREIVRRLASSAQTVEVLEPDSFDRFHLPDAKNLPLVEFDRARDELDPARPVIVYCHDTA